MPQQKIFPPRPTKPFQVGSTQLNLDNVANHTRAGFPQVADDLVRLHYFRYVSFLESKQYLLAPKTEPLGATHFSLELWSHDLTPEGYRFVQYTHDRWIGRLLKYADTAQQNAYLDKWHQMFLQLPASTFAERT